MLFSKCKVNIRYFAKENKKKVQKTTKKEKEAQPEKG